MTPQRIDIEDCGLIEYGAALDRQYFRFDRLQQQKASGAGDRSHAMLLCEHPHVYTLGRSGQTNNLLVNEEFLSRIGATYFRTDRGGDITYHGPGQLVGYPIVDLEALHIGGLKEYIDLLEQAIIETLGDYGIAAGRMEGATGVWIDDAKGARKICAIGVRGSRYVTMHGFALNVTTDLAYFNHINPCGFTDKGVTSIERELSGTTTTQTPPMDEVKRRFTAHFLRLTGLTPK